MALAALLIGTLAGITSGLVAVVALGAPVWAGFALWSGLGSVVMVAGLALSLPREEAGGAPAGRRITA